MLTLDLGLNLDLRSMPSDTSVALVRTRLLLRALSVAGPARTGFTLTINRASALYPLSPGSAWILAWHSDSAAVRQMFVYFGCMADQTPTLMPALDPPRYGARPSFNEPGSWMWRFQPPKPYAHVILFNVPFHLSIPTLTRCMLPLTTSL